MRPALHCHKAADVLQPEMLPANANGEVAGRAPREDPGWAPCRVRGPTKAATRSERAGSVTPEKDGAPKRPRQITTHRAPNYRRGLAAGCSPTRINLSSSDRRKRTARAQSRERCLRFEGVRVRIAVGRTASCIMTADLHMQGGHKPTAGSQTQGFAYEKATFPNPIRLSATHT